MNDFAEKIIQAAFSWVQGVYAWLWNAATQGVETSWFTENWLRLVLYIVIAGLLVDILVWLLRRKPWRRFLAAQARGQAPRQRAEFPHAQAQKRPPERPSSKRYQPPERPASADADLSDRMRDSISQIVSKARGEEPITLRAEKTDTEIPIIIEEAVDLPEDIPHVHLKPDVAFTHYEDVTESVSPLRQAADVLRQGRRSLRRSLKTFWLKLRLALSRK